MLFPIFLACVLASESIADQKSAEGCGPCQRYHAGPEEHHSGRDEHHSCGRGCYIGGCCDEPEPIPPNPILPFERLTPNRKCLFKGEQTGIQKSRPLGSCSFESVIGELRCARNEQYFEGGCEAEKFRQLDAESCPAWAAPLSLFTSPLKKVCENISLYAAENNAILAGLCPLDFSPVCIYTQDQVTGIFKTIVGQSSADTVYRVGTDVNNLPILENVVGSPVDYACPIYKGLQASFAYAVSGSILDVTGSQTYIPLLNNFRCPKESEKLIVDSVPGCYLVQRAPILESNTFCYYPLPKNYPLPCA